MKKVLSIIAAATLVAAATSAGAASIVGTKHDLSSTGKTAALNGSGTQICVYCHTPHNAYTAAPLWNRNNGKAASTYTLYSGLGMANRSSKSMTEDSVSLFCMSCHDGSSLGGLVKNNYAKDTGGDSTQVLSTATLAGKSSQLYGTSGDMRSTHPINFAVEKAASTTQGDLQNVIDGKIVGPVTSLMPTAVDFPLFRSSRSATQTLECSSCHSVHDNKNTPFLRATMAGSSLCLGCHNK